MLTDNHNLPSQSIAYTCNTAIGFCSRAQAYELSMCSTGYELNYLRVMLTHSIQLTCTWPINVQAWEGGWACIQVLPMVIIPYIIPEQGMACN